MNPPADETRLIILVAMLIGCSLLEWSWPLRTPTQPKLGRILRNTLIAGAAAVILRLMFYPLALGVASITAAQGWGILSVIPLPIQARIPLALLALDYTLHLWHQLLHKVPGLWRFHNVHHTDLDLDSSTALRFHFGELALSAFYRSAQILVFGISPVELLIFEIAVTTSAQFHHSNIRLAPQLERWLSLVIVTPRMHGVHHSIIQAETDSNFGTILSLWDRWQGTLRSLMDQRLITIGVPAYRDPQELTLIKSLLLPFQKQRDWKLPDGRVPTRGEPGTDRGG